MMSSDMDSGVTRARKAMLMATLMEMDTFESRDLYRRAEIQIKRGRFREASALLTHALKISPDNPIYVLSLIHI